MDIREEFEGWVQERSVDTPAGFYPQLTYRCSLDPERYMISWVDSAWEGWKAARSSIEVKLPDSYRSAGSKFELLNKQHMIDALTALGIRTK